MFCKKVASDYYLLSQDCWKFWNNYNVKTKCTIKNILKLTKFLELTEIVTLMLRIDSDGI